PRRAFWNFRLALGRIRQSRYQIRALLPLRCVIKTLRAVVLRPGRRQIISKIAQAYRQMPISIFVQARLALLSAYYRERPGKLPICWMCRPGMAVPQLRCSESAALETYPYKM